MKSAVVRDLSKYFNSLFLQKFRTLYLPILVHISVDHPHVTQMSLVLIYIIIGAIRVSPHISFRGREIFQHTVKVHETIRILGLVNIVYGTVTIRNLFLQLLPGSIIYLVDPVVGIPYDVYRKVQVIVGDVVLQYQTNFFVQVPHHITVGIILKVMAYRAIVLVIIAQYVARVVRDTQQLTTEWFVIWPAYLAIRYISRVPRQDAAPIGAGEILESILLWWPLFDIRC